MEISFFKYQGTGNDFILIDDRSDHLRLTEKEVSFLCNRRFGIGSDGLMILTKAEGYDFRMRYFNSDGKESTMCGNGGRCITAFAAHLGLIDRKAHFVAIDGEHESEILESGEGKCKVRLKMRDVPGIYHEDDGYILNTGSPHLVMFVHHVAEHDVVGHGRNLRHSEAFHPEGTNVDFAELQGDQLFVRTYERGVEDETLSCGTGVTAAVIAAALKYPGKSLHQVKTLGGELKVDFRQEKDQFTHVWLEGPAEFVYRGQITIKTLGSL